MALAVYYAQKGNRNLQVIMIILTMIFGTVFLGVKVIEYTDKYNSGLVPVTGWNKKTQDPTQADKPHVFVIPVLETRAEAAATNDGKPKPPNPKGEFQWNYGSHVVDYGLAKEKETGKQYLTDAERAGYFTNDVFDPNKYRDKIRIFYYIYFVLRGCMLYT